MDMGLNSSSLAKDKETTKNPIDSMDPTEIDAILNASSYAGTKQTDKLSSTLITGFKGPSGKEIKTSLKTLDASRVVVSHFNKRNQDLLDVSDLENLIVAAGSNLIPVLVRPIQSPDYDYELIYGSRRRYVCEKHNLPLIALVGEISDEDVVHLSTVENMGSMDLSPFEWSEQFQLFIDSPEPLYEGPGALAEALGKNRQHISKIYNLKTVPIEVYSTVYKSDVTVRRAAQIKKLWDSLSTENRSKLLNLIAEEKRFYSFNELIDKLSGFSSVPVFKSKKESFSLGANGRSINTSTQESGTVKVDFIIDQLPSDAQLEMLKRLIHEINSGA